MMKYYLGLLLLFLVGCDTMIREPIAKCEVACAKDGGCDAMVTAMGMGTRHLCLCGNGSVRWH